MPPRNHSHNKKKNQSKENKKNTKPTTELTTLTSNQKLENTNELAPEKETVSKLEMAVAFSLGAEHATVTLLPNQPGQWGQVIANEDGERHIPCVVSFVGDELVAGTAAKAQMIRNVSGSARFFVPLLGLEFDDKKVQSVIPLLSVPVEKNEEGHPIFILSQTIESPSNTDDTFSLVEQVKKCSVFELVCALLATLKQSAESYTGYDVTQCYLSYPLDFTSVQYDALKACAEQVGLQVRSMITEPLASVLAFQQHHTLNLSTLSRTDGLWLLVDTGALMTRLTLMTVMSGLYTVLGHNSVICGGEGLDKLLSEYFLKDVTKKQGCVVTHPKSLMKLTLACETTRKVLSTHATSECHVEALYEGNDYVGTINRVRFESVTRPWRSTWESHLDEFLATLAIDPLEIDRVCCIGGVLKSPRLLNVLEMLFTNAIIDTSIESDFAVAYGTALHSLQSQQHSSSPIHTSHAQYPLGLLDQAERFVSLVPKGAALPLQLKVVLDQPSQPTTAIIKFAEGKELLPPPGSPPGSPTTLSETTKSSIPGESHGLTTASSTHEDTYDKSQGDDFSESEEEGPEPIYLGTVLGEFIFQLASGIDSIELTLHIDEAGQVLLNGTAINKASGISESLTLTI